MREERSSSCVATDNVGFYVFACSGGLASPGGYEKKDMMLDDEVRCKGAFLLLRKLSV